MAAIKVCRVEDRATLRALDSLGVEFAGLHLVSAPDRARLEHLRDLAAYCRGQHLSIAPVLVSKHVSATELARAIDAIRPRFVQLHDAWTQEQLHSLRKKVSHPFSSILMVDPVTDLNSWGVEGSDEPDYLLFDHARGGTGKRLPLDALRTKVTTAVHPFFIAGGLSPDNVRETLDSFHPFAVDVQSGLEVPNGSHRKDIRKILNFVSAARAELRPLVKVGVRQPAVYLSLTDIELEQMDRLAASLVEGVDGVHLDHADGSVDRRFVRDSAERAGRLHALFPLVSYDLHLFVRPLHSTSIQTAIRAYTRHNPFIRSIICYVDPADPSSLQVPYEECRTAAHFHRVNFGICFQARPLAASTSATVARCLTLGRPDVLSVVGPSDSTPIDEYRRLVPVFCSHAKALAGPEIELILDRSVTRERLDAAICSGPISSVGGKSIWQQPQPLEALRNTREAMAATRSGASPL